MRPENPFNSQLAARMRLASMHACDGPSRPGQVILRTAGCRVAPHTRRDASFGPASRVKFEGHRGPFLDAGWAVACVAMDGTADGCEFPHVQVA